MGGVVGGGSRGEGTSHCYFIWTFHFLVKLSQQLAKAIILQLKKTKHSNTSVVITWRPDRAGVPGWPCVLHSSRNQPGNSVCNFKAAQLNAEA